MQKKQQVPEQKPFKAPAAVPDITYVVSAYNRPVMLPVCLWSIAGQTHHNFECIVTDNATDAGIAKRQKQMVEEMKDPRFRYVHSGPKIPVSDPYWSAEYGLKQARGLWYCFPCDDTYLMPHFAERMLAKGVPEALDFVFCEEVLVGPTGGGNSGYRIWQQSIGRTVKTSFIVRASSFPGFSKPNIPSQVAVDYFFSQVMAWSGKRCGSVRECLVVHN